MVGRKDWVGVSNSELGSPMAEGMGTPGNTRPIAGVTASASMQLHGRYVAHAAHLHKPEHAVADPSILLQRALHSF